MKFVRYRKRLYRGKNQINYGHEKEIIMWEEWFSTTEEGLNLLINRVSKY